MNRHINQALMKTAFRYDKPGQFKQFRFGTPREIAIATLKQPGMSDIIDEVIEEGGHNRFSFLRKLVESQVDRGGGVGGTVYPAAGGRTGVLISRDYIKKNPDELRGLIAHEAFHAKGPQRLRHSEIAAHAVGGWRGPRPAKSVGGAVFKPLERNLKANIALGQLISARPQRFKSELLRGLQTISGVNMLRKVFGR